MMPLDAIRAIFKVNLAVKKSEKVLIFTDRPAKKETLTPEEALRRQRLRDIASIASCIGGGISEHILYIEYPATGGHGKEPPAVLWEAAFGKKAAKSLKDAGLLSQLMAKRAKADALQKAEKIITRYKDYAVDAVVALSNYSTTHTTFRDFLTRITGARYASMPLFDILMLEGPMNVDWKALEKKTKKVADIVKRAASVEIKTPNGTRISFGVKGRKPHADTGIYTKPGSCGNLPAGEVFLAPLEGTAEGRLVLEWAPTRKLASHVILTVEKGNVTGVSGEEEFAAYLREKLKERKDNSNIAELGIGTNPNATRPDNILESEKILGTVHIALGDNSTFGGKVKTPFHQDFVFFRPTLILLTDSGEKITLIDNGKLAAD